MLGANQHVDQTAIRWSTPAADEQLALNQTVTVALAADDPIPAGNPKQDRRTGGIMAIYFLVVRALIGKARGGMETAGVDLQAARGSESPPERK